MESATSTRHIIHEIVSSVIGVTPNQGNLDRGRIQVNASIKEAFLGLREDSVRHLYSLELNYLPRLRAVMGTIAEGVVCCIKGSACLLRYLNRLTDIGSPCCRRLNPCRPCGLVQIQFSLLATFPGPVNAQV